MNRNRMRDRPLISELANEACFIPLIEWYVSVLPERAAAIEMACSTLDLESVQRLALALMESAGGYGFPSITEAARRMEGITRTRCRLDDLLEECALLVDLCRRARAMPSAGRDKVTQCPRQA